MKDAELLDIIKLKAILLESLTYPDYAKPEFLLRKQQESNWGKEVFLSALRDACSNYELHIFLKIKSEESKNPNIDSSKVGIPLEEETEGKIKNVYVGFGKESNVINKDVIKVFLNAIKKAKEHGEPETQYSDLQVISLFDLMLRFTKREFEIQAGTIKDDFASLRNLPKGFTGKNDKGEPVHLLHTYYIQGPKHLLDYSQFELSLRNLLLNSQHPENLKRILKPKVEVVKQIVQLWNDKVQPLDVGISGTVTYRRFIEIHKNHQNWTYRMDAKIEEFSENAAHFANFDLVRFAFDAGNLIANEVLTEGDESEKIKEPNTTPTLKSIFMSENAYQICLTLLDYLEITIDGVNRLTKGRIGKLTGAIDAMRQTPGLFKIDTLTEEELLSYFNNHLGTAYKTYSKRNEGYEESKDSALRYLKNNFKK